MSVNECVRTTSHSAHPPLGNIPFATDADVVPGAVNVDLMSGQFILDLLASLPCHPEEPVFGGIHKDVTGIDNRCSVWFVVPLGKLERRPRLCGETRDS
jgi:hypothetical protein